MSSVMGAPMRGHLVAREPAATAAGSAEQSEIEALRIENAKLREAAAAGWRDAREREELVAQAKKLGDRLIEVEQRLVIQDALRAELDTARTRLAAIEQRFEVVDRMRIAAESDLRALLSSQSIAITAPLRAAGKLARRLLGRR